MFVRWRCPFPFSRNPFLEKGQFSPDKDQSNPTELLVSFVEESKKAFFSSNPFRYQKKKNNQPQPFMRLKNILKKHPVLQYFLFHIYFLLDVFHWYSTQGLNWMRHTWEKRVFLHIRKKPQNSEKINISFCIKALI